MWQTFFYSDCILKSFILILIDQGSMALCGRVAWYRTIGPDHLARAITLKAPNINTSNTTCAAWLTPTHYGCLVHAGRFLRENYWKIHLSNYFLSKIVLLTAQLHILLSHCYPTANVANLSMRPLKKGQKELSRFDPKRKIINSFFFNFSCVYSRKVWAGPYITNFCESSPK